MSLSAAAAGVVVFGGWRAPCVNVRKFSGLGIGYWNGSPVLSMICKLSEVWPERDPVVRSFVVNDLQSGSATAMYLSSLFARQPNRL